MGTDERIDSQMFVLKKGDTNIHPSDLDGEGDLNADYAVRVSKFFEMYKKTLAPAVPGPDPAKPLFKGYQKFDTSVLGSCGDFPYGYVGEEVKPCIFFKLNNIWGWDPKPVQCGDSCTWPPMLQRRRRERASGLTATAGTLLTRRLLKETGLHISQLPDPSPSATSPTWARGIGTRQKARTSATTHLWWRSRSTWARRIRSTTWASWCTWSAAPTTAGWSTTRRTNSASSSSRCKSCKRSRGLHHR